MVTIDIQKIKSFHSKVENILTLNHFDGEPYDGIGMLFSSKLVFYTKCRIDKYSSNYSGIIYGFFDLSKLNLTYTLCNFILHDKSKPAFKIEFDDALDNLVDNLILKEEDLLGYFYSFKK